MKKLFSYKSFWIVFIIISAIIFASSLNFFRTYKSEINVLVIPKSDSATASSKQIVSNLSIIPHSILFFEKLVENHPEIANPLFDNLAPGAKKQYWNRELKTQIVKNSGIIKISVYDKNQSRSQTLAGLTSDDLLIVAGNYYNTQSDINIRIIDKPVTSQSTAYPLYSLIAGSIGAGFILTFASFIFSLSSPKKEVDLKHVHNFKRINREPESDNFMVKQENIDPARYEVSEEEVKARLNKLLEENYK